MFKAFKLLFIVMVFFISGVVVGDEEDPLGVSLTPIATLEDRWIVFHHNYQLYRARADFSYVENLTLVGNPEATHKEDRFMAFSPDGSRIVYHRRYEGMYVMDFNGENKSLLMTSDQVYVLSYITTWTSDDLILFMGYLDDGPTSLYQIRPDGSGLEAILSFEDSNIFNFVVSSDESKVLLQTFDSSNVPRVYLYDWNETTHIFTGDRVPTGEQPYYNVYYTSEGTMQWAPNSNRFIIPGSLLLDEETDEVEISLLIGDVAAQTLEPLLDDNFAIMPHWLADGNLISYMTYGDIENTYDLALLSFLSLEEGYAFGGEWFNNISLRNIDLTPSWSLDGQWVVFMYEASDDMGILPVHYLTYLSLYPYTVIFVDTSPMLSARQTEPQVVGGINPTDIYWSPYTGD